MYLCSVLKVLSKVYRSCQQPELESLFSNDVQGERRWRSGWRTACITYVAVIDEEQLGSTFGNIIHISVNFSIDYGDIIIFWDPRHTNNKCVIQNSYFPKFNFPSPGPGLGWEQDQIRWNRLEFISMSFNFNLRDQVHNAPETLMRIYLSPEKTHGWSGDWIFGMNIVTYSKPAAFNDFQPSVIGLGPSRR